MESKQNKTPTYVLEAIKRYYHKNKDNVEFQKKVKERSQKYYEDKKMKERREMKAIDSEDSDTNFTSTSSTESETNTQA